jgi:hypothetical protein
LLYDTVGGDTNNDGSNSTPSAGQWNGIQFNSGSTGNVLDHVDVRYGGQDGSFPGEIVAQSAGLSLTNSIIETSYRDGTRIQGSNPTITGETFQNNQGPAISMDLASNPAFTGTTASGNNINAVVLDSGTLAGNAFWNSPSIVYWLSGNLTVPQGATLTVAPGQIVKVAYGNNSLIVNGTLLAQGVPGNPVVFTSYRDDTAGGDTNHDGASTGGRGDWGGIQFGSTSTGDTLDTVHIGFTGSSGVAGAVAANGASLSLTDALVHDSYTHAVYAQNGAMLTLASDVLVNDNNTGIRAESGSLVHALNDTIDGNYQGASENSASLNLTNCLITNNSNSGVFRDTSGVVTVSHCDVYNPSAGNGNYNSLADPTGSNGNISADPMYANRATGDYHLQSGSPAINAGTLNQAPADDFVWNYRTANPAIDLGAYEFTGTPRVAKNAPSGKVSDVVSDEVLTFRTAMDTTSFSLSSGIVSFTGPNGAITATGFEWLNVYQLEIDFPVQAVAGAYELIVSGSIHDAGGHAVGSNYTANFTLAPPRIVHQTPNDFVPAPVSTLAFTFTRPMDQTSFSLSDILAFTGPGGALTATGYTWLDSRTLQVSFASQSTLGAYNMVLGPNLVDVGGNLLDQNQDGIAGETPGDNYTATFTIANIFHISGTISTSTTVGGLVIVDDNVTLASGVTLTLAAGTIVKFQDTKGITVSSGATLNSNGTLAQPVIMTSYHDDSVGGDTDQDGGVLPPQAGDWGQVLNNGTANFNYTQVLYGSGNGNTGLNSGALRNAGGTMTLSNSIISQAFYDGLGVLGGTVTVTNSSFIGADRAVVSSLGGSMVSIVNCTFDDNRIALFAHVGGGITVTNSIIYNSLQIGVDTDGAAIPITYSDVCSTVAGNVNYSGMTDPTNTQGDISADPLFEGASAGNYRLKLHSPAIDAADGTAAPATDSLGNARFTVPNSGHTGKPASGGAYADMGAFEFVQGATSNIDLTVTGVSTTTATALEGDMATVQWTVQNIGTALASGGWHDAVYLSASPVLTPDAILLGTVLNTTDLGASRSYATPAQGTFTLPGVVPGNYYFLIRCNSDIAVFEGSNTGNNVLASPTTVAIDLPALTLGTPATGKLAATGASELYRVTTTAGSDLNVTLTGASGSSNELYVSFGSVPTRQAFDARGVVMGSANQTVSIASTQAGTYYVLLYGSAVTSSESFTLTASTPGFSIASVSPTQGSNTGQVTLAIYGAQFTTSSQPELVDSAGATIMPLNVYYGDSGLISATFDLTGHPAGAADVQVVNGTNVVAKLPQSFTILAGAPGQLQASFDSPSAVRVDRVVPITIHYSNTGGSDLPAAILELDSTSPIQLSFDSDMDSPSTSLSLIAVNPNAPAGFLPPGAQGSITVYAEATTDGQGSISLSQDTYPAGPIDWAQIEPEIRPAGISDAAWNPIFAQIQQDMGSTWASFENALAQDATLFARGQDNDGDDVSYNLQNVFQLEVDNAMAKVNPSASGKAFLGDSAHPLVGATITLQDQATNTLYFTVTRTDGSYVFPLVSPGTYALQSTSFVLGSDVTVTVARHGVTVPDLTFLPTGSVAGNVNGDPTGAPLANVSITATAASGAVYTTGTDNNGAFDLTGLPTGTYTLSAHSPLYTNGQIDGIAVGGGQQVRNLAFLLENGATISGTLTGLPANVPARTVISAIDANGITQGTAVPQSDDSYAIDSLPAGTYTVTAQVPGFVAVSTAGLVVGTGKQVSAPNLALATAGSIQGSISLPASASFIDQPAVAVASGSTTVALDPVNADGSFTVPDLAPGTYTLTATIPGYLTIVTQVTISAGQTTMLPLVASTGGTISGTVKHPNNNAVSGADVTLVDSLGNTTAAITDANGNYQFPILPLGTYNVFFGTADEPIGSAVAVTLSANSLQGTANLTTPATFTVSGAVFASDGSTALAGAEVMLLDNGQLAGESTTDGAGHYSLNIEIAGTYDLFATIYGMSFAPVTGINLSPPNSVVTANFTAGQLVLNGVVSDGVSGTPVAGALVLVLQEVGANFSTPVASTTTASDGSYAVAGLAAGNYSAVVTAASYGAATSQVTLPDPHFNLFGYSTITGEARNSSNQATLSGATVTVIDAVSKQQVVPSVTTDINGNYTISDLPPGVYDVLITNNGYQQSLVQDVHLTYGVNVNIGPVGLDGATSGVSGTISTGVLLGSGVFGATITLTDANGIIRGVATTGEDGTYQLQGIPPGTYTINVSSPPAAPVTATVTVAADGTTNYSTSLNWIAPERYPPILQLISDGIGAFNNLTGQAIDKVLAFFSKPVTPVATLSLPSPPNVAAYAACLLYLDDAKRELANADTQFGLWRQAQSTLVQTGTAGGLEQLANILVTAGKIVKAIAPVSKAAKAALDAVSSITNWPANQLMQIEKLKDILAAKQLISDVIAAGKAANATIPALDNADADPVAAASALKTLSSSILTVTNDLAMLKENLEVLKGIAGIKAFFGPISDALDAAESAFRTFQANTMIGENLTNSMKDYENRQSEYLAAVDKANYQVLLLKWCYDKATIPGFNGNPPKPPGGKKPIQNKPVSGKKGNDPNDLIGPAGFSTQGFIQPAPLPYQIDFQNDPAKATAAVQVVTVTNQLDPSLDLSAFQFTGFGFGQFSFTVPSGLSHYQTTIDLRPDGIDLLVPVTLDLNNSTGLVTATFQSLDPTTMTAPDGINDGFLPIDDAQHDGVGFFAYTVSPKAGLATGTVINNQASVVFDTNAPLATPTATNTIDTGANLTSSVAALPAMSPGTFTINWSGTDTGGSGIASYSVYYSDNGGPLTPLVLNTTQTSATFTGAGGHTYTFDSIATDNVGNIQPTPATPQATTAISTSAASHLSLGKLPTKISAGGSFTATVQALNDSGKVDPLFNGTVTLALARPGQLAGPTTVVASKGVATFTGLVIDAAGSGYALTASNLVLAPGATSSFTVSPAAATRLVFTTQPPASVQANSPYAVAITAEDAFGNVANTLGGKLTLSLLAGGKKVGSASGQLVNGVASFPTLAITRAANGYSLAAASGKISGTSSSFAITPQSATQLVVTQQPPANATVGVPFAVTVAAEDGFGDVDPSFTGNVGLVLSGNGSLSGTASTNAVAGVATFTGLSIDTAGTGDNLQVISSLPPIATASFNVVALQSDQLVFITEPATSVMAGSKFTVVVKAENGAMVDPLFKGAITLTLSGPGPLIGHATATAKAGVATFAGLAIDLVGTGYSFLASAVGFSPVSTPGFVVTPGAVTHLVISTPPPGSVGAGAGFGLTVSAEDAFGNVNPSFTGMVSLSLSKNPTRAVLNGTTSMTATAGVATFPAGMPSSLSINTAASGYVLTASSGRLKAATGSLTVTPGTAMKLVITTQPPASVKAGSPFAITVKAEDQYGNVDTTFGGTINLTLTNGTSSVPLFGPVAVVANGGAAVFSGLTVNSVDSGLVLTASSGNLTAASSKSFTVKGTAHAARATTMDVLDEAPE